MTTEHTVSTVRVKADATEDNPSGFVVINELDFDPAVHVRHEDAPAVLVAPPPVLPPVPVQ